MLLCLATRRFSVLEQINGWMKGGGGEQADEYLHWANGGRCEESIPMHVCNPDSLGANCGLSVAVSPVVD